MRNDDNEPLIDKELARFLLVTTYIYALGLAVVGFAVALSKWFLS